MPDDAKQAQTAKVIESPMARRAREDAKRLADKYILPDGSVPTADALQSAIADAAKLDKTAYELERRSLAERFGVRLDFLDGAVAEVAEEEAVQPFLASDAPWEETVPGPELLYEICGNIRRYISMPKHAALACALWVLFAHTHDAYEISPLLLIHSPEPECGKSNLLEVLAGMSPKALMLVAITPATVFRLTDKFHPTLFFDEGDAQGKEQLESLRGIMNGGHKKGTATVPRVTGEKNEVKLFSLWAPKATARIGIDGVHATQISRSIQIAMRRRTPEERARNEKLPKNVRDVLVNVRRRCARWAADTFDSLREAKPALPHELSDRAQDNWEPLFAIADLCGVGDEAREAARLLCAVREDNTVLSALLLSDLHDLFEDAEDLPSSVIVARLAELEDRPWGTLHKGQPITEQGFAKLLKPYAVTPKKLSGLDRLQGYRAKQFARVWETYLKPRQLRQTEEAEGVRGDDQPRHVEGQCRGGE
jgi:putative DNA primase/helicase